MREHSESCRIPESVHPRFVLWTSCPEASPKFVQKDFGPVARENVLDKGEDIPTRRNCGPIQQDHTRRIFRSRNPSSPNRCRKHIVAIDDSHNGSTIEFSPMPDRLLDVYGKCTMSCLWNPGGVRPEFGNTLERIAQATDPKPVCGEDQGCKQHSWKARETSESPNVARSQPRIGSLYMRSNGTECDTRVVSTASCAPPNKGNPSARIY